MNVSKASSEAGTIAGGLVIRQLLFPYDVGAMFAKQVVVRDCPGDVGRCLHSLVLWQSGAKFARPAPSADVECTRGIPGDLTHLN